MTVAHSITSSGRAMSVPASDSLQQGDIDAFLPRVRFLIENDHACKRVTNAAAFRSFEKAYRGRCVDGVGSACSGCADGSGPVVARGPRDSPDGGQRGGGIRDFRFAAAY